MSRNATWKVLLAQLSVFKATQLLGGMSTVFDLVAAQAEGMTTFPRRHATWTNSPSRGCFPSSGISRSSRPFHSVTYQAACSYTFDWRQGQPLSRALRFHSPPPPGSVPSSSR